jgi:hypothetical protein
MTDKEAFNKFARGTAFAGAVVAGLLMFVAFFGTFDEKPREKFKVVDHYGTCAIVRYTDPSQQWHYFLDCGNEHLEEKGG